MWGSGAAGQRGSGRRAISLKLVAAFLVSLSGIVGAQDAAPLPRRPTDQLTVYLMTMGPGKAVWERFGHNAIWIHDPARGTDQAYNYGLFDLRQEKFLVRFLQGRMWYWMQGFPSESYVQLYRRANRSVWIQELEMSAEAKRELQDFLEWNELPENRFYHYDYYRDNCSTRVRDALDRALGGRIQDYAGTLPTGKTYRFHTQRLTANDPLVYTGLLLGLGHPVDREISAWDEMFLPLALRDHIRNVTVRTADGSQLPAVRSEQTLFKSSESDPPRAPPFWLPAYVVLGVAVGMGTIGLARAGTTSPAARRGFVAVSGGWSLLAGLFGIVLAGLWAFTDHSAAYQNENLFQVNPLQLALFPLLLRSTFASPRWRLWVAGFLAALSLAGLLLKLVPGFYQVNGEIIGLALPIHLGVAAGCYYLSRCIPSRASA
ncbi:MAG TPA: DUF4105 domain-containing protein [Gemmatimonadales bacterium]|nr:DUF4105 domain-containing protein [Gemmatimonadales bacterium]